MTQLTTALIPGLKSTVLTREYIAVSLNTVRIIYKCKNKNCKHIWAHDYRKAYTFMGGMVGSGQFLRYERSQYDLYRISDGEGKSINHLLCPECNRVSEEVEVKGKTSEKKCDARCLNAKNGDCECSCGGVNHGANHMH